MRIIFPKAAQGKEKEKQTYTYVLAYGNENRSRPKSETKHGGNRRPDDPVPVSFVFFVYAVNPN